VQGREDENRGGAVEGWQVSLGDIASEVDTAGQAEVADGIVLDIREPAAATDDGEVEVAAGVDEAFEGMEEGEAVLARLAGAEAEEVAVG
jgi:hypothetical protein